MAVAEGEAQAIGNVFDAIHQGKPDEKLITLKYLEMLPKLAEGEASDFQKSDAYETVNLANEPEHLETRLRLADALGQGRFGRGIGKDLQEMVRTTGSAGGDNGNRDRALDRVDQLDVESEPGAVSIDTVQQDFTCPQLFAGPGQGYGV